MKPDTILFANQKGGVGKTTLCREIGIYLSTRGHKVLLVGADPQGNLGKSLTEEDNPGLYEALTGGGLEFLHLNENLFLLAGGFKLTLLEKQLIGEIDAYTRLRDLLSCSDFTGFDYIFIDTPPSLGVLTVNALAAANYLIIPMRPSLYSMQGTNDLMATISKVKKSLNPGLEILGVIINCFDSIPVISRQIKDEIKQSFKERMFETILSKTIKYEEAIAQRKGVINIKLDKSKAGLEVDRLGAEILLRLGKAV
jgi:chromosome partitioning protein